MTPRASGADNGAPTNGPPFPPAQKRNLERFRGQGFFFFWGGVPLDLHAISIVFRRRFRPEQLGSFSEKLKVLPAIPTADYFFDFLPWWEGFPLDLQTISIVFRRSLPPRIGFAIFLRKKIWFANGALGGKGGHWLALCYHLRFSFGEEAAPVPPSTPCVPCMVVNLHYQLCG